MYFKNGALTLSDCDFCQRFFACSCGIKQIPQKYQSKYCTTRMIESKRANCLVNDMRRNKTKRNEKAIQLTKAKKFTNKKLSH